MEPKDYIITEISGEYATLTEKISGETLFIALALLPPGSDIGQSCTMKCSNIL